MEPVVGAITAILSFLAGAVLRPFFTGYSTKKGEHLATNEDIKMVVDEVKAVTEATKRIEAEISVGVWNKQKRWEMKREVLFEAARRISEIDDGLLSNSIVLKEDRAIHKVWEAQTPSQAEELSWAQTKHDRLIHWRKVSSEFDMSEAFVLIVCSKGAAEAFRELGKCVTALAADMIKNPDAYDSARPELFRKILLAQKAIRTELEVDA